MKTEKKNKNRSCIYDINRHKYLDTNIVNIKCLIMIMLICTKQNLSNIWSSVQEKVKQQNQNYKTVTHLVSWITLDKKG